MNQIDLEQKVKNLENIVSKDSTKQVDATNSFSYDSFLTKYGIDPNSPDVVQMVRDGKTSPDDWVDFIVSKKVQQTAQPNVGQVAPTGGATLPPTGKTVDALTEELNVLMRNPAENFRKISELQKELATKLTQQ